MKPKTKTEISYLDYYKSWTNLHWIHTLTVTTRAIISHWKGLANNVWNYSVLTTTANKRHGCLINNTQCTMHTAQESIQKRMQFFFVAMFVVRATKLLTIFDFNWIGGEKVERRFKFGLEVFLSRTHYLVCRVILSLLSFHNNFTTHEKSMSNFFSNQTILRIFILSVRFLQFVRKIWKLLIIFAPFSEFSYI